MGIFDRLWRLKALPAVISGAIVGDAQKVDHALHKLYAERAGVPVRDGIHHEYFIDPEPVNGRYVWLCRVYSAGGQVHEMTGSEESNVGACQSAISWAESVKKQLRGAA